MGGEGYLLDVVLEGDVGGKGYLLDMVLEGDLGSERAVADLALVASHGRVTRLVSLQFPLYKMKPR